MHLRSLSTARNALRLLGIGLLGPSVVGLLLPGPAAARSASQPQSRPTISTGARSLRFEPNHGQFEERVRFLARGKGYGLYLARAGATLALQANREAQRCVLSMRVVGARAVEPEGEGELAGHSNYAFGADAQAWVDGVTSFANVRYAGLLPGVELVYHSTSERELEYDFVLGPGAEPQTIQLEFDGISELRILDNGDASFDFAAGGSVRQQRPVAYQVDDAGAKRFVRAAFRRLGDFRLGFSVGDYDQTRPLVIDPALTYASYLGGSQSDQFDAVAADSAGNTYAVGYTTGSLFPTKLPAQPGYAGGFSDAVIVKLNAAGTDFVYSTFLGGNDSDQAYGVAVDANGSAYVTGVTYSTNFPTKGALQPSRGGGLQDAFVAKLSGVGALVYSTYLGGSADDLGQAIAVNAAGEAYVAGTTFSANFPRLGAFQNALSGTNDAFVSKLNIAGGTLVYSTLLGGSSGEYGQGIAVDGAGGAIVVGQTGSNNFPTLLPAQPSFGGSQSDAFATRLTPAGSALVYSTYLGGTSVDVATAVTQVSGAAVVVGYTSSNNFPHMGADQAALAGSTDAFLTRVHSTGGSFDSSTYLGGTGADQANGVAIDNLGFIYVVGETASADFPTQLALPGLATRSGPTDGFLAAFGGSEKQFATLLGGNSTDSATGIAIASGGVNGNALHVLGNTLSPNFPTLAGFFNTPLGAQDGFVARLSGLTLTPAPAGPRLLWVYVMGLLLGAGLVVLSFRRTSTSA